MLTEDERALMIATIMLHGFDLYERFDTDGVWRALLVGEYTGKHWGVPKYEVVVQVRDGSADAVSRTRGRAMRSSSWQRFYWFKLTDQQLTNFHNTVISTC